MTGQVNKIFGIVLIAFLPGMLGTYLASRRILREERRERWVKLISYFAIVYIVMFFAIAGPWVFGALMLAVVTAGGFEIRRAMRGVSPHSGGFSLAVWAIYITLCAGLLVFAGSSAVAELLYVYAVVVFFDGFSQVTGQLIGHHKIAPQISPGKTVEGVLGGLAAAVLSGTAMRSVPDFDLSHAALVCSLLSGAALSGDLAASWLKRKCGVKDFGVALPGHGGILDRFDSLIVAGPVFLAIRHPPG